MPLGIPTLAKTLLNPTRKLHSSTGVDEIECPLWYLKQSRMLAVRRKCDNWQSSGEHDTCI